MKIIAGRFRGRNLLGPPGRQTRPITGLIKKSLFDILADRLVDATVLDVFCGTGTIGLEAISRGAARCIFIDRDRGAIAALRRNIDTFGVQDSCTIWPGEAKAQLRHLGDLERPLDLAFVDPPFALVRDWDWSRAAEEVFDPIAAALAAEGLLILRLPDNVDAPLPLGRLSLARQRRYGDMQVLMLSPQAQP